TCSSTWCCSTTWRCTTSSTCSTARSPGTASAPISTASSPSTRSCRAPSPEDRCPTPTPPAKKVSDTFFQETGVEKRCQTPISDTHPRAKKVSEKKGVRHLISRKLVSDTFFRGKGV